MMLFALPLAYKWVSGYSDNMLIGGLLPYKDAKNYYHGANLIMNGLPMINAGQSTERPLFPGFLSSLFLLTDQNLKTVLAVTTQLAAIGLFLSAREVRNSLGSLPAGLYITLMYFYIQPLIGYTLSELLGFILGCFAFCLLWRASSDLGWFNLILGLVILLMAVSARAGAFLIFPALVLWTGWIFRGEKRFSIKAAASTFIIILTGYLLLNRLFAQLVGIPPGSAFENFSYAIYGQVRGGTGWHSAIEELGTREPEIVYRAAIQFFLEHPLSLLIGFAKSYRDLFLPGDLSIFPFRFSGGLDLLLWAGTMILLTCGLMRIFRSIHTSNSALMAAGFVGVFTSIPFLPPIDGGSRFYASTMPFFFVLPAVGVKWFLKESEQNRGLESDLQDSMLVARFASIFLIVFTLIVPVAIYSFRHKPIYTMPSCPPEQVPFATEIHPGSYIDLVKTTQCGLVPNVCLGDFEKNNTEKATDDYYHALMSLAEIENAGIHIVPARDLIEEKFHYFIFSRERLLIDPSSHLISGCATEIRTINQSIYYVESMIPDKQ